MSLTNAAVGRVFGLIADLLEVKGGDDAAKALTYRRAARSVESWPEDVGILHREGRLREIPGVGEALAKKIGELVDTGRLGYFERLSAEVPTGLLDMLRIPGVGGRTVNLVWRERGITGVDELEASARAGLLRELPGLGPKKEQAILDGIASYRRETGRHPLGLARPVGEALVEALRAVPAVRSVSLAGSVRRWRDTAGNINLVVGTDDPAAVAEDFAAFPEVREIKSREIEDGPGAKAGARGRVVAALHHGLAVDLRLVPPGSFAAALGYFTGSAGHVARLGERAAARGLTLDETGLSERGLTEAGRAGTDLAGAGPRPVTVADEEDLYRRLGLAYVPPELREDGGEVAAAAASLAGAEAGGLPRLVELADIRGDLHVHSNWSDGSASLDDLAAAGRRMGYAYIAVSDHTKSLSVARGLDEKRVREQIEAIAAVNRRLEDEEREADGGGAAKEGFRLLAGTEVDILAGGELDLPDPVLADLDIVTASIHSRLRQPAAEITRRLVAAAENEHVDVLGHPTGRLLGYREASALDLEAVLEAAARTGTLLEVSASPDRLDLKDTDARLARERGCRVTVSTDAHHLRSLGDMAYGVATARRAWLGPGDVANTRSLADLRRLLS